MSEGVIFREEAGATIAKVVGPEMNSETCQLLQIRVNQLAAGGGRLVLDLSGVTYVGSNEIGFLITLLRSMKAGGGQLSLACLTPQIRRIMHVVGLEKVFQIAPSIPDALAASQTPTADANINHV